MFTYPNPSASSVPSDPGPMLGICSQQLNSRHSCSARLAEERDRVENMPEGPEKDKAMRKLVDDEVNSLPHQCKNCDLTLTITNPNYKDTSKFLC